MRLSTLTTVLLLTGWSVGASPASVGNPSSPDLGSAAGPQNPDTVGNQQAPSPPTGVMNANPQSPSPSAGENEAVQTAAAPQTQDTVGNQAAPGPSTVVSNANPETTSASPGGNQVLGAASPAVPAGAASTAPVASDNSNPVGNSAAPVNLGGASTSLNAGQQAAPTAPVAAGQALQPPASQGSQGSQGAGVPLGANSGYLNGAAGLLSPSLMPDLEEVIHDAAYLLREPTTKNTKTLLGSVFDLINPDSVAGIKSAVYNAQDIVTPEVVDELKKVNLVAVFEDIGYLWTKGKSMLNSVKGLVSEQVIQDIEDLIEDFKNFLAQGTTADLEEIVHKLEGVLPPEVTNSLKTVVSNIGPFIDKAKPIFDKFANYMSQVNYNQLGTVANSMGDLINALAMVMTPENIKKVEEVAEDAQPYFEKVFNHLSHMNWKRVGHLVSNMEYMISAFASAMTPENIKKIEDVASDAEPYVDKVFDHLSNTNWHRVGHLITNMEDLIGTFAAFMTPARIQDGTNAFNKAKRFFSQSNMSKARDLGRSVWSKLSPGAINRASDLMGNAEMLLGAAAPLVAPDSLDHGKHMYAEAKSYFTPDFIHRLNETSHKLGILYDSIAPGITTPKMDQLGGLVDTVIGLLTPKFANETTSLIGTASGIMTPSLVDQVHDWIHSLKKMFTPTVRNETKIAIGSAAHVRFSASTFVSSLAS